MSSHPKTILAVGAAGRFAGLVVPELVRRGCVVRALVHTEADGTAARDLGANAVAIGDLADRNSVDAALSGVGGVFYIAPAFLAYEAQIGAALVEAAQRAARGGSYFRRSFTRSSEPWSITPRKDLWRRSMTPAWNMFFSIQRYSSHLLASMARRRQTGVLAAASRFSRVDDGDVAKPRRSRRAWPRAPLLAAGLRRAGEVRSPRNSPAASPNGLDDQPSRQLLLGSPSAAAVNDRVCDVETTGSLWAGQTSHALEG